MDMRRSRIKTHETCILEYRFSIENLTFSQVHELSRNAVIYICPYFAVLCTYRFVLRTYPT